MSKQKVIVGMSGGKDSTASVVLLKEQGFDVHGLTMGMGLDGEDEKLEKIKHLASVLEIPHKTIDIRKIFKEEVINYFLDAYTASLTPNPCVICNIKIKFDRLMNAALLDEKSDFYATGHYAKKKEINGKFFLTEPEDRRKSQIYFLSMIGNDALEKVLFPIAEVPITKVWKIVENLPLASSGESQDVCFIDNTKLETFLKDHLQPSYFQRGDILNVNGEKIGQHRGAVYFTIGQRRGTGFASDRKLYVVAKNVKENTITLGEENDMISNSVELLKPVYWRPIEPGETLKGKFRYMSRFYDTTITETTPTCIKATLPEPVKALTPGQIGALYKDDVIIAAGFIK